MGSLMAGWDSPVLGDDTKARVMRNRSLTKEEVEAFWRQRGKPAREDGGGETLAVDVTSLFASPGRPMEKSPLGSSQRSRSPASSPVAAGHEEIDVDEEQLGLPQRAAARGEAGHGAQLHAAVPRRRPQRL
uniref:Uncharacterized protein n=1 Tax=Aegilops tauschii subsp. strangulata TaxID=200361 RepID=A0A453MC31_AEGTS